MAIMNDSLICRLLSKQRREGRSPEEPENQLSREAKQPASHAQLA
jgi:hypothetical protein